MKNTKLMKTSLALFSALLLAACTNDAATTDSSEASSTEATTTEQASSETSEESTETEDAELVDGEYALEEENFSKGHKIHHSIVVQDGKIVESNFGYTDEEGNEKYDNQEYNDTMEGASGISYADAQDQLNNDLVAKQNPEDVDIVSGATSSAETFVEYSKLLVEAAKQGDNAKISIDNEVSE